jgi:hypothetical protein
VQGRFLLDIIIRKSTTILELLAGENQTLLVWGNALLILNFGLDIVDGVRRFHLEGNRLASKGLDEDLHTTAQTENQVESGFLLNVVVREGAAIFELLAGEDETLLVWGNAFFVLNLRLHVVDGVRRLDLQGDGLSSQCLDENLHATAEAKHEMEGRLLLDVIVGQGAAIFELLAGEDKALLVWWDALLVLNFGLYIVDGVGRLDLKGDGLSGDYDKALVAVASARQTLTASGGEWVGLTGLDEDLHGCGACSTGVGVYVKCASC